MRCPDAEVGDRWIRYRSDADARRIARGENAALRQQLIVLSRRVKKPHFRAVDRFVVVLTTAFTRGWSQSLILVKPETVLRWHRDGFRLFWRRKSRPKEPVTRISPEVIELIRKMSRENRRWGAERIRGELLKLGLRVAKRTVQRYMVEARRPGDGQSWSTFLKNHTVWACDFLQTYDCCFRPIFAFFIVDVHAKRVVHVGVTRAPTEEWTAQQLRQATPFGECAQVIVRDRDAKFGGEFDRVAKGVGMRVVKTAVRTPDMNAVCERFLYDWLCRHPALKALYEAKEVLHGFYRTKSRKQAKLRLTGLCDALAHTRIPELETLRSTLVRWRKEILAYWYCRLTNARTEGFNNKAKLVKRRAFGYVSFQHYRLRVLNACSG